MPARVSVMDVESGEQIAAWETQESGEHVPAENQEARVDALASILGDRTMASALVSADSGVYPSDPAAVADMIEANRAMETKALRKYLKLNQKYGATLREAAASYQEHRQRGLRLFAHLTDGQI